MDFNSEQRKQKYWDLMVDSVNKRLHFISSSSATLSTLIAFLAFYDNSINNVGWNFIIIKVILTILLLLLWLSHYVYLNETIQGGKTAKEAMEKR